MYGRSPRAALARPVLCVSRGVGFLALTDFIDAISAAIVGVDVHGRVVVWNPAAEALFGWRREEVLGREPPIIPPALRQEWRLQMRQSLEGGRGSVAAETQRINREGRLVPV